MFRLSVSMLAAILLASIACSAPIALAPTATPTASATPTATPSSTATPTPTSTPTLSAAESVQSGQRALLNGDWNLAVANFARAIAGADDHELVGEARFGQAVALYRAEDHQQAQQALSQFIADYTPTGHARLAQAHALRGQIGFALGNFDQAVEDYQTYLGLGPEPMTSYAQEWLGDALRAIGRPEEAVAHYQQAVAADRAGNPLPVMVRLGRALLELGALEEAIAQFDRVAGLTEDHATRASMNLLASEAYGAMGDQDSMYARLLDSVDNYPTAYDSYVGLVRLVNDGVPVDEFQRGLVDYHAGAYEPAVAAFGRIIAAAPTAEAYYYRGLSQLALGNSLFALTDFDFVVANYPDHSIWPETVFSKARTEWAYLDRYSAAVDTFLLLAETRPQSAEAPEAMLQAGRIAERMNDLGRAAQIWLDLTDRYPDSELASEAAFQAGIARYRLGDPTGARAAFERALQLGAGVRQRSAAALWVGKSYAADGQTGEAQAAWTQAAQIDPTGYFSERAAELLAGGEPFERSGGFNFDSDVVAERQQAEDWLRATFGVTTAGSLSELDAALAGDPRLVRGEELWQLGRWEQARAEFQALRLALASDPEATYRLMHRLIDLGLYREAIFASRQILNLAGMDDAGTMNAPTYFNRIRFGPYFADLILPEAAKYGLDGLFLLSVVRQESLFEGFAISSASARGLMQVIPPTGASIASQLGWPPDYEEADLYRPVVSVRFGTFYLSQQRDRFDGDLYAALAAYNAGPGNSTIWKELAPDDPDLFLEVVRFEQPQRYIQVIYEVYQIYRSLYANP